MKLERLSMPPLNTTLMGVVKGVGDYHGVDRSVPMLFGVSGHAFLINIHQVLCPSGPYCWKHTAFEQRLKNLGIEVEDVGFLTPEASEDDRSAVEARLRKVLDQGVPCALLNMEHQLITGYDETGFDTAQPWPNNTEFPPSRLSFGTWEEFGEEIHVSFSVFRKGTGVDERTAVREGLELGVDFHRNPSDYNLPDYGCGPEAYRHWIAAADEHGGSHGNWWNATVWSECRRMAGEFFGEIAGWSPLAADLATTYREIGETLGQCADKEMDAAKKIGLLKQVAAEESVAIERVAQLAAAL